MWGNFELHGIRTYAKQRPKLPRIDVFFVMMTYYVIVQTNT